jgi:cell division protease FtsH
VFLGRDFASHPDYSDQVAFEIDSEIRRMIDEAHDEALDILTAHRPHLDTIAETLIQRETIEMEELGEILEGVEKRPQREGRGAGVAVARRSVKRPDPGPPRGGTLN